MHSRITSNSTTAWIILVSFTIGCLWLVGIIFSIHSLVIDDLNRYLLHKFTAATYYVNQSVAQNLSGSQFKPVVRTTSSTSMSTPISQTSLLSRDSNVTATCDTRGNLGPCSVVIQMVPGSDWLKDRWQAASDMGGTAIPGPHWIMLDFHRDIVVQEVRLDWETAYADNYRLEGFTSESRSRTFSASDSVLLFNSSDPHHKILRSTDSSGRSPGVKMKLPLHIIHTIDLSNLPKVGIRYLRLYIIKPAAGWGVSLWQFDVTGYLHHL